MLRREIKVNYIFIQICIKSQLANCYEDVIMDIFNIVGVWWFNELYTCVTGRRLWFLFWFLCEACMLSLCYCGFSLASSQRHTCLNELMTLPFVNVNVNSCLCVFLSDVFCHIAVFVFNDPVSLCTIQQFKMPKISLYL